MASQVLDRTWKILNEYPSLTQLKQGKLILVKTRIIKSVYGLEIDDNRPYQVGILLSNALEPKSKQTQDTFFNNVYHKKMYKVLICGIILLLFRQDISEVL